MPTKGEPHENLVLFEDDLYKAFYALSRKVIEFAKGEVDAAKAMAITSTINGAALLMEELLKKESEEDDG